MSNNYNIESMILSNMMLNSQASSYAIEKLVPSDFTGQGNQTIFACMCLLFNQGKDLSPEEIFNQWCMQEKEKADMLYLYGLQRQTNRSIEDISSLVNTLKDSSLSRQLFRLLSEKAAKARDEVEAPEDLYQKTIGELEAIFSVTSSSEVNLAQAIDQEYRDSGLNYLEYIKNKMENPHLQTITGLSCGYRSINDKLDGINKGHYIIIGARPGVGKTTFILNIMRKMSISAKIPIGFFSLEMSHQDLLHNLACQQAQIDNIKTKQGRINAWEYQKLCEAKERINKINIITEDKAPLSISQIMAKTRKWVRNYGVQAIFIDYLGEIVADQKFLNRQEAVQYVSKCLRNLAKSLKVPIICCAQLNRESERTATRPPIKSDLRESGQIEADAHSILLLHRPESDKRDEMVCQEHEAKITSKYDNLKSFTGEGMDEHRTYQLHQHHPAPIQNTSKLLGNLEIHIVKNRFGEEGKIQMNFIKETGQIEEVTN